ncbi:glycerol acyltransferase [Wenzhouxiangella sp. XN79A]|uniref:lysophospholipid acyltransferase family protein n=1 Tax=Wenzhouxiangella sp. XN79A TaxID=2724193 RepID=UPI00144AB9D1|nr:lysophospholipid acyltransferase family protein [Wenzhouxiangella sp. XN79A]NKI36166.1 glycerol acyltransferase [Wenzhouxiangella sp. XN79A]
MKNFARFLLRAFGWTLTQADPGTRRYVLVFAPHTSNWDFVVGLLAAWALGLKAHWMGKHSLFRGPLGPVFRWWGGIPVDRSRRGELSRQMAARFAAAEHFVLGIAPEGTRSFSDHWKSGFWHIARAAGVPVVMAYIDYPRKQVGMGASFVPGDDLEADFVRIRAFYADKRGRFPDKESTIRPRAR